MNYPAAFAALSLAEQAEVLALFAHELTVAARESYEAGADGLTDAPRVRAINEIAHRVTAHLASLLRGDSARYPDAVLIPMVLSDSADSALSRRLSSAFARSLGLIAAHA